jgi:hypothetical protein
MSKKSEKRCAACGEPMAACVRCKATKWNEPWRLLGLPAASWLALILGTAVAAVLWMA